MTIAFFSRAVRITIKCHLSTSSFFEVYLAPQLPHYKAYPFHPAPCLLLPKHNNVGILIIHVLVLLSFSSSQAQPQLRFRPWTKCWISLHNSPCCSPWPLLRNGPPGSASGAPFSPQPGAAWSRFAFAPSLDCSCLLTHCWVTWIALLAQRLTGAGAGRGGNASCCLTPLSAAWFSSLIQHVSTNLTATSQAFRLPEFFNAVY